MWNIKDSIKNEESVFPILTFIFLYFKMKYDSMFIYDWYRINLSSQNTNDVTFLQVYLRVAPLLSATQLI